LADTVAAVDNKNEDVGERGAVYGDTDGIAELGYATAKAEICT
jgi:hypothetical protein